MMGQAVGLFIQLRIAELPPAAGERREVRRTCNLCFEQFLYTISLGIALLRLVPLHQQLVPLGLPEYIDSPGGCLWRILQRLHYLEHRLRHVFAHALTQW